MTLVDAVAVVTNTMPWIPIVIQWDSLQCRREGHWLALLISLQIWPSNATFGMLHKGNKVTRAAKWYESQIAPESQVKTACFCKS